MENFGYFKYLGVFSEKSREGWRYSQHFQLASAFSTERLTNWQFGTDFANSTAIPHNHLEDKSQVTSQVVDGFSRSSLFKEGSSLNPNAKSFDITFQDTSSYDESFPQLSAFQAQNTCIKKSDYIPDSGPDYETKNQPNCFYEIHHTSNTSQEPIQNNENFSYTFDSWGVNKNLKRFYNNGKAKSIMHYVNKVQSNPEKNVEFMSAKIFSEFQDFFYELIYNFFLNENYFSQQIKPMDISVIKDQILVFITDEDKSSIFIPFFYIISQALNLDEYCQQIIYSNCETIITRLLDAYILNLFYYILDRSYYKNYLFGSKNFCLNSVLFECTIISHSYFYQTEAERVKKLFTIFVSKINERMEKALKGVLICFDSKFYLEERVGAKKLYYILDILMHYNIENIIRPPKIKRPNFGEALEQNSYSSNPNFYSKLRLSNFIGIISKTQSVFLKIGKNSQFYFDRLYKSYMLFLIYAHNNEKKDDLQPIISELEKYLDCFPQLLLKRKNFVFFKYLFGFYENELNIEFIRVFFKIIDSVIYHIKYSEIDVSGGSANQFYVRNLARNTLWFMNKLGSQLKNKFAKDKSKYSEFWAAYDDAFSNTSMDVLYVNADILAHETASFSKRDANEALCFIPMPLDIQNPNLIFMIPVHQSNSIPDFSIDNISCDDILDEFWYRYEMKFLSPQENFEKKDNLLLETN